MRDPVQTNAPYEEPNNEEVFVKVLRGCSTHSELEHKSKPVVTRCYDEADMSHETGSFRIVRSL